MSNTSLSTSLNSIYNLGEVINNLYSIIAEAEGEIDDEQFSFLQLNKNEVTKIGMDIVHLKNTIEFQSAMINAEIERLQQLKAKRDKEVENIQRALMYVLLNFGEQDKKGIWRLDLNLAQLSSRKNPESVVIEDESLVPNEFKTFDLSIKGLDNKELEILQKLFAGDILPEEVEDISKFNIELRYTTKISKKDLKVKLQEEDIDSKYEAGQLTDEEYAELKANQVDLGASIKKGDLNLVIK